MLADRTHRFRKAQAQIRRCASDDDELIDWAIRAVAIDDESMGQEWWGGQFNKRTREFVGPPAEYITWEVGAGQMPVLKTSGGRFVCVGSQGAGKTEILARCIIKGAMLLGRNKEIGVVAPTQKRMQIIWGKVLRLLDPSWIIDEPKISAGEIILINGCTIRFVSAHTYSAALGSAVQGFDWVAVFIDEEQDINSESMTDCVMRGRDAKGDYLMLSACTLKDTPDWRVRKRGYDADADTTMYRMILDANPWVTEQYKAKLKRTLTKRAYRLRVLALDTRPEKALYPDFLESVHLKPVPRIGVRDITRQITGKDLLCGYDPGKLHDASIFLKAFELLGQADPVWWVVGELVTHQTTARAHAVAMVKYVHERFALKPNQVIIRADPHGNTEERPHVTVYRQFQARKFDIRPAVYSSRKNAATPSAPGNLPKEARFEVLNTLILNEEDQTRFYIDIDDQGVSAAPYCVDSLEMSERGADGKGETQSKDLSDLSHFTANLGYALYPYEHTRLSMGVQTIGASRGH